MLLRRMAAGLLGAGALATAIALVTFPPELSGQQPLRFPTQQTMRKQKAMPPRPAPPVVDDEDDLIHPQGPAPRRPDRTDEEEAADSNPPPAPRDENLDRKTPVRDLEEIAELKAQARPTSANSDVPSHGRSDAEFLQTHFRASNFDSPHLLVNSTRISLSYELKNTGPSGVSGVDVWQTRDGRKWERIAQTVERKPPAVVEVEGEGLHGFTIIPRSGVGLARKPPVAGDTPQVWVEVDLTPPQLKLEEVVVHSGKDTGKVTIRWSASDKNMSGEGVVLSYSESPIRPWKTIAANARNNGTFTWQMPEGAPYRFYVRIEVRDNAGNTSIAQTPDPVVVDLSTPETVISGASPINR